MGDGTLRKEFLAQLKQLSDLAAKSTAPSLTATWIAASDEKVKELILTKLDAGSTLQGVMPAGSQRAREFGVIFVFDRPAGAVNLVSTSFLATVDLQSKRVIDVADPYVADEHTSTPGAYFAPPTGGLPFALSVPTNAPRVIISDAARAPYRMAEQAFFRARGIRPGDRGFPGDPAGPGRPGFPGDPGGSGRPGFPWPGPDWPGRPGWGAPGIPSAAESRYWAITKTESGAETTTTTDDPPKSDDGMTDIISDDNETDWVPTD